MLILIRKGYLVLENLKFSLRIIHLRIVMLLLEMNVLLLLFLFFFINNLVFVDLRKIENINDLRISRFPSNFSSVYGFVCFLFLFISVYVLML
jgi:hypothetical protein